MKSDIKTKFKNIKKSWALFNFKKSGAKPWSNGYNYAKWDAIEKSIHSAEILECFEKYGSLPTNYGIGIDERSVEYPWVLAHLPKQAKTLLDAGSSLNFEMILNHEKIANKKIYIANLNPELNCFWQKEISYIYEDMRSLLFKNNTFDIITCISTLEHIGMDNTVFYTTNQNYKESASEDYLTAITELKRILKTGGTLLLTVPFGKKQDLKAFQQFNKEMIDKITAEFNGKQLFSYFYKYDKLGWKKSDIKNCSEVMYSSAPKIQSPDLAASARAVACLKLIK